MGLTESDLLRKPDKSVGSFLGYENESDLACLPLPVRPCGRNEGAVQQVTDRNKNQRQNDDHQR